jgi:hypothetical protein
MLEGGWTVEFYCLTVRTGDAMATRQQEIPESRRPDVGRYGIPKGEALWPPEDSTTSQLPILAIRPPLPGILP